MLIQEQEEENLFHQTIQTIQMIYRKKLDPYILYKKTRWCILLILVIIYIWRITDMGGYYVISYILGMYQIQLILEYFTPLGLPQVTEEEDDDEFNYECVELPTSLTNKNQFDSERRPLLRTSSEFQIWQKSTFSFILSYFSTFVGILDIPVYWPFLFFYFLSIALMTYKRYIKHMRKYGYSLFDFSKQ